MKSFLDFGKQLEEAKATYTIKDSEGNLKHAGTDKDTAYKTHKFLNTKESGHKLYKNGVPCLAEAKDPLAAAAHKIIATAMANSERMKTVQIPTPAERRAQIEKRNKEKQMKESMDKKPYIVISQVSDNTGTRADGEKVEKMRAATKLLATSPEHALQLSKAHHVKSGRKVHSASIKEDIDLDETHGKPKTKVDMAKPEVKSKQYSIYSNATIIDLHKKGDFRATREFKNRKLTNEQSIDESARGEDKVTNLRQAHDRHMEKALAANKAGDDSAVKVHQRKMQMIQGKLQKLKQNEEVDLGEECEILFELSDLDEGRMAELSDDLANMSRTEFHKTYGKPKHHFDPTNFKKPVQAGGGMDRARALAQRGMQSVLAKEDYIDELGESTYGQDQYKKYPDMKKHFDLVGVNRANYELSNMKKAHQFTSWDPSSKQMIASINAIQKHKRSIKEDFNLEDYTLEEIQDFMMSEDFDRLDELSKGTLGNYLKKARVSALKHHMVADLRQQGADYSGAAQYRAIANKRDVGYKQALTKLNKEGTVVTYKEFMASIEEGRIDDLRDKMAADREKRLNKMDYSKEKGAKKNPITKVRGHSYGAGDEGGEADPVKVAEPAEKRGRGRPAGSKSGARA